MNSRSSKVRIVAPYPLWRELKVKEADSGEILLDLLQVRFPFISEEGWKKRIDSSWVKVEDEPGRADQVLKKGQVIRHYNPRIKEPSVPDELKVLKVHKDWLLVWKPAPMPVHQGGRYFKNTALSILHETGYPDAKIVHRLDSVTSGVMLFGRNKETVAILQSLFKEGKVRKEYLALVCGEVEKNFRIDKPIKRKKGFVFECGTGPDAREAVTEIEVVDRLKGYSIVKAIPKTGRTHQIRLHLKTAGYPIADDPIYGPDGDQSGMRLQNSPIRLVSSSIKIEQPEVKIDFESDQELNCFHLMTGLPDIEYSRLKPHGCINFAR